jgi:excisionase family DNA binding protein
LPGAPQVRDSRSHGYRSGEDDLLSVAEVAQELHVALPTVYRWIRQERVAWVRNPLRGTMAVSATEVDRIRSYVHRRY